MDVQSDGVGTQQSSTPTVAIQRLGAGSDVVRGVAQSGEAVIVTEGGSEVAAIADAASYQHVRVHAAGQLLRDLQVAGAEADAGNVVDQATAMRQLREVFAGL